MRVHRPDAFSGFGRWAHRQLDSDELIVFGGYSGWATMSVPWGSGIDVQIGEYHETDPDTVGLSAVPSMNYHRRCRLGDREGICGTERRSPHRLVSGGPDWDLTFLPTPLQGWRSPDESPARFGFTFDQSVQSVLGDDDLDGDGRVDWVVGGRTYVDPATLVRGGGVAVLLDPPLGDHDLWPAASAIYSGTLPDAQLGTTLAAYDLNQDGHGDVGAGAVHVDASQAAVFAGPHDGDRTDQQATWRLLGDGYLGVGLAMGDYDGDGLGDLAVGQPGSVYAEDPQPGKVFLFFDPPPGLLTTDDADLVLTTDRDHPDGFGLTLATATLDADPRDDLVVTAHRDSTLDFYGGAVHLHFGAELARQAGR
jgi:hypothetical protein